MKSNRLNFFKKNALLVAAFFTIAEAVFAGEAKAASSTNAVLPVGKAAANLPVMVEADGRLRFDFGPEHMVLPGGLQPFMFTTASGAIILQAQAPHKPVNTTRMHYPWALATAISRDDGNTWTDIPLKAGDNGLNLEGGGVQCRNGEIVALDTYITPGKEPGTGIGQLYTSRDDWQTLQGPQDVPFGLPGADFYASKDDGGHPHDAERLHRRILELPNGDLVTTFYGCLQGDHTPSTYMPTMMKSRVVLVRSSDRGRHWKMVSTVAVDPLVGTEGFGEAVLARISAGKHAGRMICFMRTGRELYESFSDDDGQTWSRARGRVFANLDVSRTELWVDMFRQFKGSKGRMLDENNPDDLRGAVVDPDLIELRSGLLVATFGVRIPQKACWAHYQHPWNGNYLAVSRDQGETWSNVVRLTSGIPTTHYTAVVETRTDNEVFVVYDYGHWSYPSRYIYGRTLKLTVKPANK